jgi:hypothetical protein
LWRGLAADFDPEDFAAWYPHPGFGNVGIAAAPRTGHNVIRHDIVWAPAAELSGKA